MKFINVVHCCNFQTLYEQSLHIKSAIPHPLIMGVIRGECPVHIAIHQVQQVLDGVKFSIVNQSVKYCDRSTLPSHKMFISVF